MSLGDELYKLGPRDESQARVEFVNQQVFHNNLVTGPTSVLFQVPRDQVLLLQRWFFRAQQTTANNVIGFQVRIDSDTDIESVLSEPLGTASPLIIDRADYGPGIVVAPGNRLVFFALSGVGTINLTANFSGLLVPRGNIVATKLPDVRS